jgi:hypothetical protein
MKDTNDSFKDTAVSFYYTSPFPIAPMEGYQGKQLFRYYSLINVEEGIS